MNTIQRLIQEEDGIGVVEIILILVDIFTIPNLCMYCLYRFKR